MTQLTNRPGSSIAVDKFPRGILNNDPAALPAERIDVVNVDSTCWLAERHLMIHDIYKQVCIGLAIYSPREFEAIFSSFNNAKTISDIFAIQASLYNKYESRSDDEKSFVNSWFNLNGSPLPGNDFAMPRIRVARPTGAMQMLSAFFKRFSQHPIYST